MKFRIVISAPSAMYFTDRRHNPDWLKFITFASNISSVEEGDKVYSNLQPAYS
jgi:hypothetical protein